MAHNEAQNIEFLIERLLQQELTGVKITEIIVVASGCTDNTVSLVEEISKNDSRIKLITEETRKGKASAVNLFIKNARCDICVLVGADTIPDMSTVERLVEPIIDNVGMTGARPVPINDSKNFSSYVVHFLWEMHHRVALVQPKCGEMVAFRKCFSEIPPDTVVDEPQIEALVRKAGYSLKYVPEAVVYNLGPENLQEIVMRRRSIVAGYIRFGKTTSYRTSSQRLRWWLLKYVFLQIARGKEPFWYSIGAILVELLSRNLGWWDANYSKEKLYIWEPAVSTKDTSRYGEKIVSKTNGMRD